MATDAEILAAADYAEELRVWRERRGLSQKALAELVHYDRTYVNHIEGGRQPPTAEFTRKAEEVLATDGALWSAWNTFVAVRTRQPRATSTGTTRELSNPTYLSWVADRSGLSFQEAYNAVAHLVDEIEAEPPALRHSRTQARCNVARQDLAANLAGYYTDPVLDEHGLEFVGARVEGRPLTTSILVRPSWLDLAVELDTAAEHTRLDTARDGSVERLDMLGVRSAVRRLAEVEAADIVLVNNPLYRLAKLDLTGETLNATFSTTDFLTYALRNDLLEVELVDALCNGGRPGRADNNERPARLPLRERYLPDVASALDLTGRHCVGGIDALLAIARPDAGDYMLLAQERSNRVLNLTGRLAAIPKAFHQPTIEAGRETDLSTTLERELEEELLGREDLELLAVEARQADPMHEASRSEPMRWLVERREAGAYRIDCTGFGINMVTGNYEFTCLVVIEDPNWWRTFGHLVGANWEAMRLRRYSTRDTHGLAELLFDPAWSNEGLFACLLGLRRLANVGDRDRLALPAVTLRGEAR